jgi:ferredoxin
MNIGGQVMKSVVLYYFSGSGNTLQIAKHVKETFEQKNYSCELKKMEDIETVELLDYAYVGLFFPVAIQSTFPLVWDFIHRLPKVDHQKIFMIDTMEAFSGGGVGPVKKVLKSKGYNCIGALEVKMISSIRTKSIDPNDLHEKHNKALMESEKFVVRMLEGNSHWGRVPVLSDWMRSISTGSKIWAKSSRQLTLNHAQCVQCKICISVCPVQALSMVDGKVLINHDLCNSCVRCVHHCPKEAFKWKGENVTRTI